MELNSSEITSWNYLLYFGVGTSTAFLNETIYRLNSKTERITTKSFNNAGIAKKSVARDTLSDIVTLPYSPSNKLKAKQWILDSLNKTKITKNENVLFEIKTDFLAPESKP